MDKIGRNATARLLSRQVSAARYFFLNLAPKPEAPLAVAFGGRETCNPDFVVNRNGFAYVGLEYVAEGAGWVSLDGDRRPVGPGTVFTWGRETHCEIRTDPRMPMLKYFLCISGTHANERLAAAGLDPARVRAFTAHSEIRSVFEDLIREGQHHGALAREICSALLALLLLKLREAGTRNPRRVGAEPARESFLRCKALIDSQAERLTTLDEVARAAGVETSSVCRLFRRFQGTSPYQYLMRRKMTLAAEHLIERGCLVKEAGQRVGFSDPYHFSRCFKSVHGVAPRDLLRYRRAAPSRLRPQG